MFIALSHLNTDSISETLLWYKGSRERSSSNTPKTHPLTSSRSYRCLCGCFCTSKFKCYCPHVDGFFVLKMPHPHLQDDRSCVHSTSSVPVVDKIRVFYPCAGPGDFRGTVVPLAEHQPFFVRFHLLRGRHNRSDLMQNTFDVMEPLPRIHSVKIPILFGSRSVSNVASATPQGGRKRARRRTVAASPDYADTNGSGDEDEDNYHAVKEMDEVMRVLENLNPKVGRVGFLIFSESCGIFVAEICLIVAAAT